MRVVAQRQQSSRKGRGGMALLNAVFLVSIMTLTLVAMINFTQGTFRATRTNHYESQVYNVARAGLVDAIAYFKRQEQQPVEVFAPSANPTNRLKADTNDPLDIDPGGASNSTPNLGIVQEFPVDKEKNLWGRYEVGKITKLLKDADGKPTIYRVREYHDASVLADPTATPEWVEVPHWECKSTVYEGVTDVTEDYGLQGDGLVWRIRSHGYVYHKDPNAPAGTPFYTAPNRVLEEVTLNTEIFRLQFRDYGAAVTANDAADVTINKAGPIKGGSGYALLINFGPLTSPTSTATYTNDNPDPYSYKILEPDIPANSLDWLEVFGISDPSIIAGLADVSGTDHTAFQYNDMSLTYIKPPTGERFNLIANGENRYPHKALRGGGILVVDGDMYVRNWSANDFSGFIYVSGDAEFHGLNNLQGQLVVKGSLYLNPTNFEYNSDLLSTIRKRLAQYRERRAALRVVED